MRKRKRENDALGSYIALGTALGAGLGTALGAAFGNIALGVALGGSAGIAIGIAMSDTRKASHRSNHKRGWPDAHRGVSRASQQSGRVDNRISGGVKVPPHRIFGTKFASVYPLYVRKAERKNGTKEEVDEIICWLTGYSHAGLRRQIERESDFETFFAQAPVINPNTSLIKGVVCGVRVEEIDDPLMQKIRYLDKLIDELARGKALDKILRK